MKMFVFILLFVHLQRQERGAWNRIVITHIVQQQPYKNCSQAKHEQEIQLSTGGGSEQEKGWIEWNISRVHKPFLDTNLLQPQVKSAAIAVNLYIHMQNLKWKETHKQCIITTTFCVRSDSFQSQTQRGFWHFNIHCANVPDEISLSVHLKHFYLMNSTKLKIDKWFWAQGTVAFSQADVSKKIIRIENAVNDL